MAEISAPIPIRLPLANGQFIDVKRRLNVGEHSDFLDRIIVPTDDPQVNRLKTPYAVAVEKVAAYLVGWSVTLGGQPVPMNPIMPVEDRVHAIRQLEQADFEAIHQALTAHEAALDLEQTSAKKSQDGASASPITSPLPSGATGDTNGSGTSNRKPTPSSLKSSTPKTNAAAHQ